MVAPIFILVVVVVLAVLAVVTAASSLQVVDDGDIEALYVFGEPRAVLGPGINFVPPFVSQTYPIDSESMTIATDDGSRQVPEELRTEVQERASSGVVEANFW